jgi:hypothetical protein
MSLRPRPGSGKDAVPNVRERVLTHGGTSPRAPSSSRQPTAVELRGGCQCRLRSVQRVCPQELGPAQNSRDRGLQALRPDPDGAERCRRPAVGADALGHLAGAGRPRARVQGRVHGPSTPRTHDQTSIEENRNICSTPCLRRPRTGSFGDRGNLLGNRERCSCAISGRRRGIVSFQSRRRSLGRAMNAARGCRSQRGLGPNKASDKRPSGKSGSRKKEARTASQWASKRRSSA